jgi:hypothetical protein
MGLLTDTVLPTLVILTPISLGLRYVCGCVGHVTSECSDGRTESTVAVKTIVSTCLLLFALGSAAGEHSTVTINYDGRCGTNGRAESLAETLRRLSERTGLNLIANDIPRVVPPDPEAEQPPATLDEIARRFDYSCQKASEDYIVLLKRFNSSVEHPQLSRLEAMEVIQDILGILDGLAVRPMPGAMGRELRGLYDALTPPQLQRISSGGPLLVRDLTPVQQQAVHRALIHQGFSRIRLLFETLYSQLKGTDGAWIESPVQLRKPPLEGLPAKDAASKPAGTLLSYVWRDKLRLLHAPLPRDPYASSGFSVSQVPLSSRLRTRVESERTAAQATLDGRVSLLLGQTTMSKVAASLSAQTSLQIQVSDALQEHGLIILVKSATIRGVLDVLCRVNDWHWYEDVPGHILVTRQQPGRPRLRTAGGLGEVYKAVGDSLPKEWRRYFSQPPPSLVAPNKNEEMYTRLGLYEEKVLLREKQSRIATLVRDYATRLGASLEEIKGKGGTKLNWDGMTKAQRAELTSCLILDTVGELCRTPAAAAVLLGKPTTYQANIGAAQVRVKDGGISIDIIEEIDGQHVERGFGASLEGPRP